MSEINLLKRNEKMNLRLLPELNWFKKSFLFMSEINLLKNDLWAHVWAILVNITQKIEN